jgi:hypothetical protein
VRLSSLPSKEQRVKLETLLQIPDGNRASLFDFYRQGPTTVSGPAFIAEKAKKAGQKKLSVHSINIYK